MLMSAEQEALIGRAFEAYLTEHHRDDILQLIADAAEEIHQAVVVNAMTLFETNMEVMSTLWRVDDLSFGAPCSHWVDHEHLSVPDYSRGKCESICVTAKAWLKRAHVTGQWPKAH